MNSQSIRTIRNVIGWLLLSTAGLLIIAALLRYGPYILFLILMLILSAITGQSFPC